MSLGSSALLTDLYQLTMLQGYVQCNMHETAVFEFFVRRMPGERNFFLAAGLEQSLDYLENLAFSSEELQWLAQCGFFHREFVDYLREFRFTGDVHAMPEGTVFFPDEPILRVTAPMPEAQFVESRLINLLHFQSLIATKAARSVLAAPGKLLVDFGMRRAHGAEAALLAARASYLAGFTGSATVEAGMRFGIPVYGTMAHSYVEAHENEAAAFERFADANPDNVVLLLDTYDTEAAAAKVVELAPRLIERGITVRGVRLDSGDLAEHARRVRRILDEGGLKETTIFASGGLDEHRLAEFTSQGAPIDGYGVGTKMDASADAAYFDCAYKLQEYAGLARRKRSEGKSTWPGRKQIYRAYDDKGLMAGDLLTLEDDAPAGEPLIRQVMKAGRRLEPATPLGQVREDAREQLNRLPEELRQLDSASPYPVRVSDALRQLAEEVDRRTSSR